jgi:invasion protein IalB
MMSAASSRFAAPFRAVLAGLAIVVATSLANPFAAAAKDAAAEGPKVLGTFGDWSAYLENGKDGKVCYAASLPKKSRNAPRERGKAYVLVSDRPTEKSFGVISVAAGFPLKKGSPALLEINGTKFELYSVADTAWSRDDRPVVAALMKGKAANFAAAPVKGEPVTDTYSLEGFGEARAAIDKACGAK